MLRTRILVAGVRTGNRLLGVVCILSLALPLVMARAPDSGLVAPSGRSLSQAIITYGYLRWGYDDFDRMLASSPNLPLAKNLKA